MVWGVRILVGWGINVLALLVADWLFDGFTIDRWGPVIFAGAVLGLANVFLKPLLTFIALPLIILTFGIAYFFVNVVVLPASSTLMQPFVWPKRGRPKRPRGTSTWSRQKPTL